MGAIDFRQDVFGIAITRAFSLSLAFSLQKLVTDSRLCTEPSIFAVGGEALRIAGDK